MIDKVLVFGYYDKLEGHHWSIYNNLCKILLSALPGFFVSVSTFCIHFLKHPGYLQ